MYMCILYSLCFLYTKFSIVLSKKNCILAVSLSWQVYFLSCQKSIRKYASKILEAKGNLLSSWGLIFFIFTKLKHPCKSFCQKKIFILIWILERLKQVFFKESVRYLVWTSRDLMMIFSDSRDSIFNSRDPNGIPKIP